MASFIIHKPPQKSPFSKAALKTVYSAFALFFLVSYDYVCALCCVVLVLCNVAFFSLCLQLESIGELDQFLLKHRKDYTDLHRTTEKERDSIEHEVSRDTSFERIAVSMSYLTIGKQQCLLILLFDQIGSQQKFSVSHFT